ncbi:hypothetical protein D046_0837A, partial [Vibrio parahaemolyticus V-223/04]
MVFIIQVFITKQPFQHMFFWFDLKSIHITNKQH